MIGIFKYLFCRKSLNSKIIHNRITCFKKFVFLINCCVLYNTVIHGFQLGSFMNYGIYRSLSLNLCKTVFDFGLLQLKKNPLLVGETRNVEKFTFRCPNIIFTQEFHSNLFSNNNMKENMGVRWVRSCLWKYFPVQLSSRISNIMCKFSMQNADTSSLRVNTSLFFV